MAKGFAAVVIVLALFLCRVFAVLANQWLWLRLLARTPRGAARSAYAAQIYLPESARRALWPGLPVFFVIMWTGMAIGNIDRTSVLFYVGVPIAVLGAVLAAGAIWNTLGAVAPNQKLAEARIKLIDAALSGGAGSEPLDSYRRFWRASYLRELLAVAEAASSKETNSTLRSVERFIRQYEADLAQARSALDPTDKLIADIDKLESRSAQVIETWRTRVENAHRARLQLVQAWPPAASPFSSAVRIVVQKSYSSIRSISWDGTDLTDLLIARKQEGTIVASSLEEATKVPSAGKGLSRPWLFECDLVLAAPSGKHTLAINKSGTPESYEVEVSAIGRTVALIAFDLFADKFVLDVYSAETV